MNDTSGRMCGKQFATYDHDSRSWKMWPATGLWGSIEFSETWPRTGSMRSGRVFERPTLVPHITANGCSSLSMLPTPVAQPSGNSPEAHLRKKPGRTQVTDLAILVENGLIATGGRVLPTPRTTDAGNSMTAPSAMRHVAQGFGSLPEVIGAKLLPTPKTSDAVRGDCQSERSRRSPSLISIAGLIGVPTLPLFDVGNA